MFTTRWRTSGRRYEVTVERDVKVRMPDGTALDGDVWRPDAAGRFPVILGAHPYNKALQSPPLTPTGFSQSRGFMESGDPTFFARRGYAHAVFNVRGSGASEGFYQLLGPLESRDVAHLVEDLARREWSDGSVGMFGVSYYAKLAKRVAAERPPSLRAIFAPFAGTDDYRQRHYHGGILAHAFLARWAQSSVHNARYRSFVKEALGDAAYAALVAEARADPELAAVPAIAQALAAPDASAANALMADVALSRFDGAFWRERAARDGEATVPAFLGACWGNYGLHLGGAFAAWRDWRGPKKLVIGPPVYLDRPLYQYQYEALRWFDHWLKGMDTGIEDDPPVRVFVPPTGEWKALDDWPPPEARWTPFFLHDGGTLSEHELWPHETSDTLEEPGLERRSLVYRTSPLVENTEVVGPSVATLYVSSSEPEALLFLTLLAVGVDGSETELTRGWLRCTQRALDEAASTPHEPVQAHTKREPLVPGEVYEVRIPIVATARLLRAGERLALRIKAADDEPPATSLEAIARGHVRSARRVRVTVLHDAAHPSRLDVPITRGNVLGTFFSGGDISLATLSG
ncbi:MAG: CocE/NonD family hydrolase [Chloroflexi bacterium]|nr:CocE/NonD family hydrolase [Chloroflexota bacterium]